MAWSQSDPAYRFAPDEAWDAPRRAELYGFSLNNPVRYLDPDGMDPTIHVGLQNLSQSNGRFAKVETAITHAVEKAFDIRQAGKAARAVSAATNSRVGTSLHVSSSTGNQHLRSSILIVNLLSPDSVDRAEKSGGKAVVDALRLANNGGEKARSELGGTKVVISVDRIFDAIRAAGLDIDDPDDRKKIEDYVEQIASHEFLHNLGLAHEDSCGKEDCRDDVEVMYPFTSLADETYNKNGYRQEDFQKIEDALVGWTVQ